MLLSKKSLDSCNLYLILDRSVNSYGQLFDIACEANRAGVRIMQIRDKFGTDQEIVEFSKRVKDKFTEDTVFIINDRPHLVERASADGVHIGQEDLNFEEARKIVGNDKIIGLSCQSMNHLKKAQDFGADYVGFGSVFKTQTKPDRDEMDLAALKQVLRNATVPVFLIGGISVENIPSLKKLGAERFAVCRDIALDKNIYNKTLSLLNVISS